MWNLIRKLFHDPHSTLRAEVRSAFLRDHPDCTLNSIRFVKDDPREAVARVEYQSPRKIRPAPLAFYVFDKSLNLLRKATEDEFIRYRPRNYR